MKPGADQKDVSRSQDPARIAGLLLELPRRRQVRVLGRAGGLVDVEAARRDLEQQATDRRPPLADEETRSSASIATIATAPGWAAMSRSDRVPSARSIVSTSKVR